MKNDLQIMRHQLLGGDTFEYWLYGDNPELLIHSGIHGDELESIELVKTALKKYLPRLPNFLYVPAVSPSAVRLKRRNNKDNVDLNRSFFDESPIEETCLNMDLLQPYSFQTYVTFHEDAVLDEFYIYDGNFSRENNIHKKFLARLGALDVKLFTGIDDPNDPALGIEFVDGYSKVPLNPENKHGFFETWALSKGITKQYIIPEIPGKITPKQKELLVDTIFESFLLRKPETLIAEEINEDFSGDLRSTSPLMVTEGN